jgi:hypothetical protein
MNEEVAEDIRGMTEAINRQTEMIERFAMTESQQIIRLLEENNRLLSIFVQPVITLQSEQLAKASIEDQKAASKATVALLRAKYGKSKTGGKR